MAVRVVGSESDGLDVLQEAMIAFARHADRRPREEWRGFFFRCLWSRLRDWQRRQRFRLRLFRPFFGSASDSGGGGELNSVPGPNRSQPEITAERNDDRRLVLAALKTLPPRQQEALMLKEWQGLTVGETALAMNCSESSVKTHLARGLAGLRQVLAQQGVQQHEQ